MPDDHSEVVPLLPIPNRTVKRLSADDSAGSRVKVGHCQAITQQEARPVMVGLFCVWITQVSYGLKQGRQRSARTLKRLIRLPFLALPTGMRILEPWLRAPEAGIHAQADRHHGPTGVNVQRLANCDDQGDLPHDPLPDRKPAKLERTSPP